MTATSGFSNEQQGSSKWANFKEGKIVTKVEGQKKEFTTLTGELIDFYMEEAEYDKKPYTKIVLAIAHNKKLTLLGFPFNSGYGQAFIKISPNIDPKLPISISGGWQQNEANPKIGYGKVFIKQGDRNLKYFFTKDNDNGKLVPAVKETEVGKGKSKQIVKDYTDRDEYFEKVLARVHEKIRKVYPMGMEGFKVEKKPVDGSDVTEPIDDLPF